MEAPKPAKQLCLIFNHCASYFNLHVIWFIPCEFAGWKLAVRRCNRVNKAGELVGFRLLRNIWLNTFRFWELYRWWWIGWIPRTWAAAKTWTAFLKRFWLEVRNALLGWIQISATSTNIFDIILSWDSFARLVMLIVKFQTFVETWISANKSWPPRASGGETCGGLICQSNIWSVNNLNCGRWGPIGG